VFDVFEWFGIFYNDVIVVFECEGVEKFVKSWGELMFMVSEELVC